MGAVISYDKPVADYIDRLNATGHVTHTAYRKDSITFHHNGGRLSLDGILEVWKTRPASAQFQVDAQARVGQYVKMNEYAWACGNTEGNQKSIHIEMANSTLSPDWQVSEVTWREACRLGGWLFAKVMGIRPTRENVHVHHDWKPTTCAGPFIDSIRGRMVSEVTRWYEFFSGTGTTPSGTSQKSVTQIVDEVIAGNWGNGDERRSRLTNAGYDAAAVQEAVNAKLSGRSETPSTKKSISEIADEVIRGDWGNNPNRAHRLVAAGYNAADVQAEVNRKLGLHSGSPATPVRLSLYAIAQQVIRGQWGNGTDRQRRLAAAGYDVHAVQAEVNRQLS
jgi:N-acetyl-anhydromuramyl-L-alanine amidase AmpD